MNASISVIIPYERSNATRALGLAARLEAAGKQVFLTGTSRIHQNFAGSYSLLEGAGGRGAAIRNALHRVTQPITVIHDPDAPHTGIPYEKLLAPLERGRSDAVFATRHGQHPLLRSWSEQAVAKLAGFLTHVPLSEPFSGLRAFLTAPLKALKLTSDGDEIDSEILVKMAAECFRFEEVPLLPSTLLARPPRARLAQASALLKYAALQNGLDSTHEGYHTLLQMEGAPRYNSWLGRRFRPLLGSRVLEVGAGIGTITAQVEEGLELLVALEMEEFYVERLKNRFRGKPHIRPIRSGVERADWEALASECFDTVLLSNVLEHIADDRAAAHNFRRVLRPGGRLVMLVPALPALFGSLDEAVGHHRRYTPQTLRAVLESAGFQLESLEWMNLLGIPGWWVNGRVFRRRAMPALQLRVYDWLSPVFAHAESKLPLPIGLSLLAVARVPGE